MIQTRTRPDRAGRIGNPAREGSDLGKAKHTARRAPPSSDYQRAYDAFYSRSDSHAALTASGLTINCRNNDQHWIITGRGLRLHHWPSSQKWMSYGRLWRSDVAAVIRAIKQGRIRMPDDARQATCRRCGAPIWWVQSYRGRWMPLDANGDCHAPRCRS